VEKDRVIYLCNLHVLTRRHCKVVVVWEGGGLLAVNTCKLMLFLVDDAEVNVSLTQSGVL